MKKIIVYDFDKTLTENDTLLDFFIFNEKRNLFFIIKFMLYLSFMVMSKFKIISNHKLKDFGIQIFLKNLPKEELEYKFFNFKDGIKYNFLFNNTDFTSDNIYIVSASFVEYLKPIFPNNVKVLASNIAYKNNTPYKLNFNCYGLNKIKILQKEGIDKIDVFYTDSISDLPLVKISKKTILIKDAKEIECIDTNDFVIKVKK